MPREDRKCQLAHGAIDGGGTHSFASFFGCAILGGTGGQATPGTQDGCITTLFVRLLGTTADKPLSALDDG